MKHKKPLSVFFRSSSLRTANEPSADDRANATSKESLKEENRRLNQVVEQLTILYDLARAVSTSDNPESMVEALVDPLMRTVNAEQAVVTLIDRSAHDPMTTKVRVASSSAEHRRYHVSEHLLGWMHLNKRTFLTNDPSSDPRFKNIRWDEDIRSVMSVPLLVKAELIGTLTIYNKKDSVGFTEQDERLLKIIAAETTQIIDNARLSKEGARMQEQLRLAGQIQRNLLPESPPEISGYDIAGQSIPAQTVGGDYFDFIEISGTRWAICLGDVSGKGLPASLLMANLQATLRGQTLVNAPIQVTVQRSNRLLYHSTNSEMFATLFYAILSVSDHRFDYCNAGHELPFLFSHSGEPIRLETGNLALGVLEDVDYQRKAVTISPGDVLVLYSDGITDAVNDSDEAFGLTRLLSAIEEHKSKPAARLVDDIFGAVKRYIGDVPALDDLTVVVVKRST